DCSTLKNAVDLEKLMRQYIDYNVTFVNEIQTGGKTPGVSYNVLTLRPINMTFTDSVELRNLFKKGNVYMIVWYAAPVGQKNPAPYSYEIHRKKVQNQKSKAF
ncbi:MAG: hypothetical protein Q8930_08710, partial [Bacillota bacterium]|nr:hypothetical protein [Bacillota bacterium]